MLANVNLDTDINLLRRNGVILVVGNRGTIEINPRGLMGREAEIRSGKFSFCFVLFCFCFCFGFLFLFLILLPRGVALTLSNDEERKEIDNAIQDGLRRGALKPVVGEERKLEDVPQAHVDILTTRRLGKMVLVPW